MTNSDFVSGMVTRRHRLASDLAKYQIDKVALDADGLSLMRNGVQVMPTEFIEATLAHAQEKKTRRTEDRLDRPEDLDTILPDAVQIVHEYYSPTTRIIFVLGESEIRL